MIARLPWCSATIFLTTLVMSNVRWQNISLLMVSISSVIASVILEDLGL